MSTRDIITEDIALALSDLQRASASVGEIGYGPSRDRAEREEREARAEAEQEITAAIQRERARADRLAKALRRVASDLNDYPHGEGVSPAGRAWYIEQIETALADDALESQA